MDVFISVARERPGRVAELLTPHVGRPEYRNWIRWVARVAPLHADRRLFELVRDSVRSGMWEGAERELWHSAYSLGKERPVWGAELLSDWLGERNASLVLDPHGRV